MRYLLGFGAGMMYYSLAGFHAEKIEWWLGAIGTLLVSVSGMWAIDEIKKMQDEKREAKCQD